MASPAQCWAITYAIVGDHDTFHKFCKGSHHTHASRTPCTYSNNIPHHSTTHKPRIKHNADFCSTPVPVIVGDSCPLYDSFHSLYLDSCKVFVYLCLVLDFWQIPSGMV